MINQQYFIFKIAILCLFLTNFVIAEDLFHSFAARSSKLTNVHSTKKIRFFLRIPGEKRIRIELHPIKQKITSIINTDNRGQQVSVNYQPELFQGLGERNGERIILAASRFAFSDQPAVENLIINIPNTINLSRQRNIKIKFSESDRSFGRIYKYSNNQSILCGLDGDQIPRIETLKSDRIHQLERDSLYRELKLNIDADSYWYRIFGSDSHNFISMFLNEAEAVYRQQLGIIFTITRQNVFTDLRFGAGDQAVHLEEYKQYTLNQDYYNTDITHYLLSGKNDFSSGFIGLAGSIGTVCALPEYNFATNQFYGLDLTYKILAHEIGHLLGAVHDENNCMTNDFIMSSFIDPSYPQNSLSSCSLDSISEHLMTHGQCMAEVTSDPIDADPNNLPTQAPIETIAPIGQDANVFISANINKRGLFTGQIDWDKSENLNNCSIQLGIIYGKFGSVVTRWFDNVNASPVLLKAKMPFEIANNKKMSLYAELLCDDWTEAISNYETIEVKKIESNKKISNTLWATRLLNKLSKKSR